MVKTILHDIVTGAKLIIPALLVIVAVIILLYFYPVFSAVLAVIAMSWLVGRETREHNKVIEEIDRIDRSWRQ